LSLLSFLTWPLVLRNIRRFLHKQDKSLTFPLSVANFILLVLPPILLTALDLLIRRSA
jgi:1,4-dihydroxy-2-naphthoate octaprenyltransferase